MNNFKILSIFILIKVQYTAASNSFNLTLNGIIENCGEDKFAEFSAWHNLADTDLCLGGHIEIYENGTKSASSSRHLELRRCTTLWPVCCVAWNQIESTKSVTIKFHCCQPHVLQFCKKNNKYGKQHVRCVENINEQLYNGTGTCILHEEFAYLKRKNLLDIDVVNDYSENSTFKRPSLFKIVKKSTHKQPYLPPSSLLAGLVSLAVIYKITSLIIIVSRKIYSKETSYDWEESSSLLAEGGSEIGTSMMTTQKTQIIEETTKKDGVESTTVQHF